MTPNCSEPGCDAWEVSVGVLGISVEGAGFRSGANDLALRMNSDGPRKANQVLCLNQQFLQLSGMEEGLLNGVFV